MTKEPKLEAAVRIVPEWQDYDQEVKQLYSRFQHEKATGALSKTNETEQPSQEGSWFSLHNFKKYLLDT